MRTLKTNTVHDSPSSFKTKAALAHTLGRSELVALPPVPLPGLAGDPAKCIPVPLFIHLFVGLFIYLSIFGLNVC